MRSAGADGRRDRSGHHHHQRRSDHRSALSGPLTTYPVYTSVLAVFAHAQRGRAAAAQVVGGLCYGIIAFATFFLAIGALVDRTGIAGAFAMAATGALLVQALTLTRVTTKGSPSLTA
jgi:hypothetical protein